MKQVLCGLDGTLEERYKTCDNCWNKPCLIKPSKHTGELLYILYKLYYSIYIIGERSKSSCRPVPCIYRVFFVFLHIFLRIPLNTFCEI
jgi:hypothetical protein